MKNFKVGDRVVLTPPMRACAIHPELYQSGVVTRVGSWSVVDVQWNGLDHPIGMCEDELMEAES